MDYDGNEDIGDFNDMDGAPKMSDEHAKLMKM